jgi:hypothetical protein
MPALVSIMVLAHLSPIDLCCALSILFLNVQFMFVRSRSAFVVECGLFPGVHCPCRFSMFTLFYLWPLLIFVCGSFWLGADYQVVVLVD